MSATWKLIVLGMAAAAGLTLSKAHHVIFNTSPMLSKYLSVKQVGGTHCHFLTAAEEGAGLTFCLWDPQQHSDFSPEPEV